MINKAVSILDEENTASSSADKLLPSYPPFTQYSKAIGTKNLFKSVPVAVAVPVTAPAANTSAQMTIKNIKILGVMLSKTPQVIIQNISTNETLVLSEGDKFENATLKDIQKDQLIFEQNGERLTVPRS